MSRNTKLAMVGLSVLLLVVTLMAGFVGFATPIAQASEKYPRIWAWGDCPTCEGGYWWVFDINGQTLPQDSLKMFEVDDPAYDAAEADNELHLLEVTVGNIKLPLVGDTRARWDQKLPAGNYVVTAKYQLKYPYLRQASLRERLSCIRKYGFQSGCSWKEVVVTATRTVKATVTFQ